MNTAQAIAQDVDRRRSLRLLQARARLRYQQAMLAGCRAHPLMQDYVSIIASHVKHALDELWEAQGVNGLNERTHGTP